MMTASNLSECLDMDMTSRSSISVGDSEGQGQGQGQGGIFGLEETVVDGLMGTHFPGEAITTSGMVVKGRSKVWNEFVVTEEGRKVMCRRCGESLAYSSSHSTSSMLKHLKRKHELDMYPNLPGQGTEDPAYDPLGNSAVNVKQLKTKRTPKANKPEPFIPDSETSQTEPPAEPAPDESIQRCPLHFNDPCVRLKWTDHSDSFIRTLYQDNAYADVTLVAENEFFKAHRLILASASELFHETFQVTPPGQHPIMFLRDVKALELRILLEFIYKGEVSIPPSLIPKFVRVGSELKVRGLAGFLWNDTMTSSVLQQQQRFQGHTSEPKTQAQNSIPPQMTNIYSNLNNIGLPDSSTKIHSQIPLPSTSNYKSSQATSTPACSSFPSTKQHQKSRNVPQNPTLGTSQVGSAAPLNSSKIVRKMPAAKRIRLLANSQAFQGSPVNFENTPEAVRITRPNETILMLSSQGESMLSTCQAGLTVLTPHSVLSNMKLEGSHQPCYPAQPITMIHPVISETSNLNDEVVYSIMNVEVSGGPHHQVLMSGTDGEESETIVVYGGSNREDSIPKKLVL